MIILYYISIIFFCAYVIGNVLKYGIPESISETAYLNKNYGFLFFLLFSVFTTLPMLVFWFYITAGQTFQFLATLSCFGFLGVGIAGHYKNGLDRKVHIISAYTAGISSALWAFIYTTIWPINLLLLILLLAIGWKVKGLTTEGESQNSIIFFGEIGAFIGMYLSTYAYWLTL